MYTRSTTNTQCHTPKYDLTLWLFLFVVVYALQLRGRFLSVITAAGSPVVGTPIGWSDQRHNLHIIVHMLFNDIHIYMYTYLTHCMLHNRTLYSELACGLKPVPWMMEPPPPPLPHSQTFSRADAVPGSVYMQMLKRTYFTSYGLLVTSYEHNQCQIPVTWQDQLFHQSHACVIYSMAGNIGYPNIWRLHLQTGKIHFGEILTL